MTKTKAEILEETRARFRETVARQKEVAAPLIAEKAPAPSIGASPIPTSSDRTARPSIRLTDEDLAKIRDVIGHALSLQITLNTSEVLRLALHKWDFQKLSAEDVQRLRHQDKRRKQNKVL